MKSAAPFALSSLLLALAASTALSFPPAASSPSTSAPTPPPAPADPNAPRHLPVEALITSMQEADSIQVGRVAVFWRDTVNEKGEKQRWPFTERLRMARVSKGWMTRFAPQLVTTSTNLSDMLPPPPEAREGVDQPWMTTVLWFSSKSRGQAYLNFLDEGAFAGIGGRQPGGFWIDDRADTLLGMMREALPGDTVIANFRAARRARLAAAGVDERLPRFGERVAVDSLPVPVTKVAPIYPDAARNAGLKGTVMVSALVGRDGLVKDMKLAESVNGLDAAALVAVRQWKFRPAQRAGKPVAVWVSVPVEFKLQ
ncbi:MAG: energy transducer TonB [Candidatus Eisenbacteria bacterium]